MDKSFDAFKEKLDNEYDWPSTYMYKFIVPTAKTQELTDLFPNENIETKASKGGNYVAFTMKKLMGSSDEIIDIYLKVKKIEGLIAL